MEARSPGGAGGSPAPPTQTAPRTEVDAEAERRRRAGVAARLREPPGSPPADAVPHSTKPFPFLRTAGAAVTVALAVGVFVWTSGGSVDRISEQDKIVWATAWAAAPPTRLTLVPAEEVPQALAAMKLPPEQRQQLQDDLGGGRTRLVWLTFTDSVVEDGDRVRVESGTYSAEFMLRNATTRVYLPEPPTGVVNVTGTHDGGGGITLAVTSGDTPVNLPFMEVGQVVGIPTVTVR